MTESKTTNANSFFSAALDGWARMIRLNSEMMKLAWGMHGHREGFSDLGAPPPGAHLSGSDDFAAIDENARRLLRKHIGELDDIGPMPGFGEADDSPPAKLIR
ncbi:MAG: hypothetical protein HRU11_04000 [Parvularculaceae bacterium]|nr:hypothetical protein [Parvularculaceae bacterium]